MSIVCLGISHHSAPVEVREQHAITPARRTEALVALRDYPAVRQAAILNTCGRFELYAVLGDDEDGVGQLKCFLSRFGHAEYTPLMEEHLYTMTGDEAVDHLFRVASGLDSMLIGEADIMAQVKDAYIGAQRAGSLGPELHRLFRDALGVGKHARTTTEIGSASVSLATAAITFAEQTIGTLRGKHVVIVGAGKMGETAARRLALEGIASLTIVNRTHERARELVARLQVGEAAEFPSLAKALAKADVVFTSTGASHFILTPGNVAEAMLQRPERPLLVIDIAVPRDVDPETRRILGVTLIDVDDLSTVIDRTIAQRRKAIPAVEAIIDERLEQFALWYQERAAAPVIASLTRKAERIRDGEIRRLFGRCPGLSERDRTLISGMSLSAMSKLLHSVMTHLRERAANDPAGARDGEALLAELFELDLALAFDEPDDLSDELAGVARGEDLHS